MACCCCCPGKGLKGPPWVMGGPRATLDCSKLLERLGAGAGAGAAHFLPPLPKSRLLARLARLLSRSPVNILPCCWVMLPPAGCSTSPNRAAPGVTPTGRYSLTVGTGGIISGTVVKLVVQWVMQQVKVLQVVQWVIQVVQQMV